MGGFQRLLGGDARINLSPVGYSLIDYKTGQIPRPKDVAEGLDLQFRELGGTLLGVCIRQPVLAAQADIDFRQ